MKDVAVIGPIMAFLSDGGFEPATEQAIRTLVEGLEHEGFRVFSSHIIEDFGRKEPDNIAEALLRNKSGIDECQYVVAMIFASPRGTVRSDGTCLELGWASAMGKKIVIVKMASEASIHPLIASLGSIADSRVVEFEVFLDHPTHYLKSGGEQL